MSISRLTWTWNKTCPWYLSWVNSFRSTSSNVSRTCRLCLNSVCVCRLNREEGEGAWCPEGQLEPSDSQFLQVCVLLSFKERNMFRRVSVPVWVWQLQSFPKVSSKPTCLWRSTLVRVRMCEQKESVKQQEVIECTVELAWRFNSVKSMNFADDGLLFYQKQMHIFTKTHIWCDLCDCLWSSSFTMLHLSE